MAKTAQYDLPLLAPSQAQKHVTVNEALVRLDAAARPRVRSASQITPPAGASDGDAYLLPDGVGGEWSNHARQIAVWSNGGWIFLDARAGWRVWDEQSFGERVYDGGEWSAVANDVSENGATTLGSVIEFDHSIAIGADNQTAVTIPANSSVIGVTGRVLSQLYGDGVTSWSVGVAGAEKRYGSGLGLDQGSYALGLSGAPVTYYSDTPLVLSAEGGSFASGSVRIALHLVQLRPPRG